MEGVTGNSNDTTPCCACGDKKRSPCRPRKQLEYVIPAGRSDDEWRCPACFAHYEDPVVLSCGDTVCRVCAPALGGVCPTCCENFVAEQTLPSRMAQRLVKQLQCHCPNRGLGCATLIGVLDVEHHLGAECEWREEECDQCHQQVRRAEMARHKDTTCARKPMACGYADVGCPTRCAQGDLAAHERDGVVAHMGLLRQRLADTSADLTQCKAQLAQSMTQLAESRAEVTHCKEELAQTRADLSQTQHDLAQTTAQLAETKEQTQRELAAVRSQIAQVRTLLFTPPAAPEGLAARWDEATKEVALDWRPVRGCPVVDPAAACARRHHRGLPAAVVYTGPECRCRYRFPDGVALDAEARFAVVAMRGLAESGPSAPPPAHAVHLGIVFTYDHDMDERGLFYYIGTQGRTQPWQNPAEAGWVTVTRSSNGGGNASDALGRQPNSSITNYGPPSWWQFDLGAGRLFTPTRYTLRHCSTPDQVEYRLQSWRLEGSVDGADGSWRTLDEHTNEPNAIPARPDAMATFAVDPERAFPARHFRVLMTGPSPNGNYYLMLSGLEMYGSLLPDPAHHQQQQQ
ncbi:putative E3 ubiquitin-protein ligase HECTD1 [Paratrimastix pyriformis]|uniref:E3 ubiquitin-protein ligase HECTD1 n=1 Tax=Paratrimastix pyriformis TaxID=342808 RepID=A0ABQ8UEK2_9EUKA|nr:putative E3 ubiquitin-protein ligase HECTD1 [Paratrimastix pyriformis]